jgi:hypothetical protein
MKVPVTTVFASFCCTSTPPEKSELKAFSELGALKFAVVPGKFEEKLSLRLQSAPMV